MGELETQLRQIWPVSIDVAGTAPESVDREGMKDELDEDAMTAYDEREEQLGEELMRHLERSILLQVIDNRWREHLFDMDYLREGIHLRGFAQIDPLVAYKNEGFTMFEDLMHSIWEEFSKLVYRAEVEVEGPENGAPRDVVTQTQGLNYSGGTPEGQPSALNQIATAGGGAGTVDMTAAQAAGPANGDGNGEVIETVVKDEHDKTGRNDPCWCGSGKKYKKCHGA
jgi:preprotein translocase subunit SecA